MSVIFNSADIAETMNNGVANVTGADSTITENYTNVVQHGIVINARYEPPTPSTNLFNKNGSYAVTGDTNTYVLVGLDPTKRYTCSTNFVRTSDTASIYFGGGSSDRDGVWANYPKTKTPNENGEIRLQVRTGGVAAPAVFDDLINGDIWIMVNEGSTPLPYEPY